MTSENSQSNCLSHTHTSKTTNIKEKWVLSIEYNGILQYPLRNSPRTNYLIRRTTYQNMTTTCIWPVPLVPAVGSRTLTSEAGKLNASGIGKGRDECMRSHSSSTISCFVFFGSKNVVGQGLPVPLVGLTFSDLFISHYSRIVSPTVSRHDPFGA